MQGTNCDLWHKYAAQKHLEATAQVRMHAQVCVQAAISQRMPRIAGCHQKPERGEDRFFPRAFRGSMALPIP